MDEGVLIESPGFTTPRGQQKRNNTRGPLQGKTQEGRPGRKRKGGKRGGAPLHLRKQEDEGGRPTRQNGRKKQGAIQDGQLGVGRVRRLKGSQGRPYLS